MAKGHRIFETFRDTDGTPLIRVSLGPENAKYAVLEERDFVELVQSGLSPAWRLIAQGYVAAHSTKPNGGKNLSPARVLLSAGKGDLVFYLDNDKTNLRRSNLQLVKGKGAIRNDKELI